MPLSDGEQLQTLLTLAEKARIAVGRLLTPGELWDGNNGGAFFAMNWRTGNRKGPQILGEVTNAAIRKRDLGNSVEKCERFLVIDPAGCRGMNTRNPSKGRWGGGIRMGDYLLAFTGADEYADEAIVVLTSLWAKLPTSYPQTYMIQCLHGRNLVYARIPGNVIFQDHLQLAA